MHHSLSPVWQKKKKKCLICSQQLDLRLLSQKKAHVLRDSEKNVL